MRDIISQEVVNYRFKPPLFDYGSRASCIGSGGGHESSKSQNEKKCLVPFQYPSVELFLGAISSLRYDVVISSSSHDNYRNYTNILYN
jgi:hypothetical protein